MHAGLNAVIYNAFETERGGARGDDIARREIEIEGERWREREGENTKGGRSECALYNGCIINKRRN